MLDCEADVLLSWGYHLMVKDMDPRARKRFDRRLLPRVVNNPDLPDALQGKTIPDWFDLDNPWDGAVPV